MQREQSKQQRKKGSCRAQCFGFCFQRLWLVLPVRHLIENLACMQVPEMHSQELFCISGGGVLTSFLRAVRDDMQDFNHLFQYGIQSNQLIYDPGGTNVILDWRLKFIQENDFIIFQNFGRKLFNLCLIGRKEAAAGIGEISSQARKEIGLIILVSNFVLPNPLNCCLQTGTHL